MKLLYWLCGRPSNLLLPALDFGPRTIRVLGASCRWLFTLYTRGLFVYGELSLVWVKPGRQVHCNCMRVLTNERIRKYQ